MRSAAFIPSRTALAAAAIAGLVLAGAAPAVALGADGGAPASVVASADRIPPGDRAPTPRPCKPLPSSRLLPKPCGPDVPPPWICEFSPDKPIGCEVVDPPYPPVVVASPGGESRPGLPGPYDPVTDAKELVV